MNNEQQCISKQLIQWIAVLFGLVFATTCVAGGSDSLRAFYDQTHAMTADFHQVVTDSKGRKVQEVNGKMLIKRPNQFRWDYHQPFAQEIVSDGKQVWLYDVELEQVTVNAISKALSSSPAALLSGDADVDKNFILRDFNKPDGLAWVSVVPKSNDTGFNKIELAFNAQNLLQEMQLEDSFGQFTTIKFGHQIQNPQIKNETFSFKVPKGVDVVGE